MKADRTLGSIYIITIAAFLFLTHISNHTVTTFAENAPIERAHCLIIDPGHGGVDGGAVSCTGRRESDYNLDIARRLQDILHLLGHETKMIRTEDISVYTKGETIAQKKRSDLSERVKLINGTENALLLSIHQNHFSDMRYRGPQVFYASTPDSNELAQKLQTTLTTILAPENPRRCTKSKGIYLMEHINCPGVLIECGFLSNPEENALLNNPSYQVQIAGVIAATVSLFLSNT